MINLHWLEAFHVIAVISWMAGIFYLPRLFVYHAKTTQGSEMDKTFQVMEKKLLFFIMTPAMILTLITGLWLAYAEGLFSTLGQKRWFDIKLLGVLVLLTIHFLCYHYRLQFLKSTTFKKHKFFRIFNEIPTLAMIIIVIMVVVQPF